MAHTKAGGAFGALAALLWTAAVQADDGFRIEYIAPAGCPTTPAVLDRVAQRTAMRPAREDEFARVIHLQVSGPTETSTGTLSVTLANGALFDATNRGTCAEVVARLIEAAARAIADADLPPNPYLAEPVPAQPRDPVSMIEPAARELPENPYEELPIPHRVHSPPELPPNPYR